MTKPALQRDGNFRTIDTNEAFLLQSPWTFSELTTGAIGAHTMFTVTGDVLVSVFGSCNVDLVGAATLEIGVAGNTAGLLAQIANATTLDNGDVYVDASTQVGVAAIPTTKVLNDGADIIMTIGAAPITAGQVNFYLTYRPLSDGANISVTTPA